MKNGKDNLSDLRQIFEGMLMHTQKMMKMGLAIPRDLPQSLAF